MAVERSCGSIGGVWKLMQNKDYLAHYGIMGMKWGIRRYQPYPKGEGRKGKFLGEVKKAVTSGANKVGTVVKTEARKKADQRKAAAEERARVKTEASKRGVSVEKYQKQISKEERLRKVALESHNPRKVAKGMQYLTDQELNQKLTRLQTEAKIRNIKMPESRKTKIANEIQNLLIKEVAVPYAKSLVTSGAAKKAVEAAGKAVEKKTGDSKSDSSSTDSTNKSSFNAHRAGVMAENMAKNSGKNPSQAAERAKTVGKTFEDYSRYSGNYGSENRTPQQDAARYANKYDYGNYTKGSQDSRTPYQRLARGKVYKGEKYKKGGIQ